MPALLTEFIPKKGKLIKNIAELVSVVNKLITENIIKRELEKLENLEKN